MTVSKKGPICNFNKTSKERVSSITSTIDKKINKFYDKMTKFTKKHEKSSSKFKNRSYSKIKKKLNRAKKSYLTMPWRMERPDFTFLIEIFLVVVFIIVVYNVFPMLSNTPPAKYSSDQLERALSAPRSSYSIEQLAKINMEVNSLNTWKEYFSKDDPFSEMNSGIMDLNRANALMPYVMFAIQYIIPPFVIAYIIWFIIKFWRYVIDAVWGWCLMLWAFTNKVISCKLGCKWYIRMVTSWSCCNPSFSTYFNAWRRKYIDRPIYLEKLKYMKKYYWAKKNYYEIPYRQYIELPYARTKVKAKFAKKIYVDRSTEVFLKKLKRYYRDFIKRPKNEFYSWLAGNNRHLATMYAKAKVAKAQLQGKPYKSVTPTGKSCSCGPSDTPVSKLTDSIANETGDVKKDLQTMIDTTNATYDKIQKLNKTINAVDLRDCDTYDKAIDNRKSIAMYLFIGGTAITVILAVLFQLIGTPNWISNLTSRAMVHTTTRLFMGYNVVSKFAVAFGAFTTFCAILYFI